ncbi:hypothetical protein TRE132_29250 [Pseudomonas chlororaphis subsp. aurantiaca]|nr:hypothetical protein TRE132_29250 [Pseudomonas chlororaphis subsp. aurantiaca]
MSGSAVHRLGEDCVLDRSLAGLAAATEPLTVLAFRSRCRAQRGCDRARSGRKPDNAVFLGDRAGVVIGVHIRCCGNGHLGFRPYGDSLFSNAKKVSKKACPSIRYLARARHALTPALLRGPPPQAIHGLGRLARHPCRATPYATPAFGLWERAGGSRARSKAKAKAKRVLRASCSRCRRLRSGAQRTPNQTARCIRQIEAHGFASASQPIAACGSGYRDQRQIQAGR